MFSSPEVRERADVLSCLLYLNETEVQHDTKKFEKKTLNIMHEGKVFLRRCDFNGKNSQTLCRKSNEHIMVTHYSCNCKLFSTHL